MTIVRRAVPGDLDELIDLAAAYCAADGHDFDETTVRDGFGPLLAGDEHGAVWVASEDQRGPLTGYVVVTWNWSIEIGGREAVLDEVYVREQGQGTGTALVRAAEADCRAHGMRRIFLETERPNEAARNLYTRLGYTADDSIWMSKLLPPDCRPPDLVLPD